MIDEIDSTDVRPAETFLEGWCAFLKCEHVRPKGGSSSERVNERGKDLSHLRLSDDQATSFQLFGFLALIAVPLITFVVFDGWFTEHGIEIGRSRGNWQGLAVALAMILASHLVVSLGMTLVWLRTRQPLPTKDLTGSGEDC